MQIFRTITYQIKAHSCAVSADVKLTRPTKLTFRVIFKRSHRQSLYRKVKLQSLVVLERLQCGEKRDKNKRLYFYLKSESRNSQQIPRRSSKNRRRKVFVGPCLITKKICELQAAKTNKSFYRGNKATKVNFHLFAQNRLLMCLQTPKKDRTLYPQRK